MGVYVFSAVGAWDFTHHSLSLYQIRCRWPGSLFAFVSGVFAVVVVLFGLHVANAWRERIFAGRIAEITLTVVLFWVPRARDSNFHVLDGADIDQPRTPRLKRPAQVHHWFLSWFVGQHANQDAAWSVASSALLFGGYVNGVAA